MDVKIGINESSRELQVRTTATAEEIKASLLAALKNDELFELVDEKGRAVVIPAANVAYLDLGAVEERPVGFGAL